MTTLAARALLAAACVGGRGVLLAASAQPQDVRATPATLLTRAEREAFLLSANIVGEAGPSSGARQVWRVSLDDGKRKHDASVQTSTSQDRSQRGYRHGIAAYELDKALKLDLVSPSVERTVNGQPAAVTWWVDDVLMDELTRRRQAVEPPDLEGWTRQMQAVRVFDELTANAYRKIQPGVVPIFGLGLLITRQWKIRLIDHKRTFGPARELENPESFARCDRTLLNQLRQLNAGALKRQLGQYLTSELLDALETRRALIVTHFEEQLARKGEAAVLYDLSPR